MLAAFTRKVYGENIHCGRACSLFLPFFKWFCSDQIGTFDLHDLSVEAAEQISCLCLEAVLVCLCCTDYRLNYSPWHKLSAFGSVMPIIIKNFLILRSYYLPFWIYNILHFAIILYCKPILKLFPSFILLTVHY